jgi:hypothetical protein
VTVERENPIERGKSCKPDPKISVVVATVDVWPAVRECLESLLSQSAGDSIEIIVVDGCGHGLPAGNPPAGVHWLRAEGRTVFQLRAMGFAAARGEIVASTEDHCRVAPDWCRMLMELHDLHPQAAGIGGAVENGAGLSTLDWVHFLIANGPFMRPNRQGAARTITGQANVSFKRRFLPVGVESSEDGVLQMQMNRDLRKRGMELRMDDRLVVWHIQSLGLSGTCRMHFHTGRCIAGFRLPGLSGMQRLLRIASCAILPGFLAGRTVAITLRKKRCRSRVLFGLPLLFLLATCHAMGEFLGYWTGPGMSPWRAR